MAPASPPKLAAFTLLCTLVWLQCSATAATASAPEPGPGTGVWPLSPRPEVVRGFEPPEQDWNSGHRGVDLSGSPGQPVRTAAEGVVTYAGRLAGRGVVVVSHGSTRTTYQPVSALVTLGNEVSAGDTIGVLEVFGSHCWPSACLHWGLIRGENYLNPLTLVGAGPVRLLPWIFTALPPWNLASTPWAGLPRPGGVPVGRPGEAGPW